MVENFSFHVIDEAKSFSNFSYSFKANSSKISKKQSKISEKFHEISIEEDTTTMSKLAFTVHANDNSLSPRLNKKISFGVNKSQNAFSISRRDHQDQIQIKKNDSFGSFFKLKDLLMKMSIKLNNYKTIIEEIEDENYKLAKRKKILQERLSLKFQRKNKQKMCSWCL